MSSHTRKQKLQAHVIGALIAFTIAVTTIVPLIIVNIQAINRGYNALDIARTFYEDKRLELLKVEASYDSLTNTLEVSIKNIGGIQVKVIRIWIVEEQTSKPHIYSVNITLPPGTSTTLTYNLSSEPTLIGVETTRSNMFYYTG